ncbi:MAG: transposase, partial [Candidatus Hodarchaeota archaeon]
MPRKARIDAPGALHHIIARRIERKKIFGDNTDRGNFLDRLGVILTETGTPRYAWALIPNHVHILLKTGTVPIATVMRRLLTGYAVTYNRRHRRHGKLFQNRYKSILCQEDSYLLELVRYIHLNPLRAKLVADFKALASYPYAGHGVILGKRKNTWQNVDYILRHFADTMPLARRRYNAFVAKGIEQGRRPDLVGGGPIRSVGGWTAAKSLLRGGQRLKGDERVLGDSTFVLDILDASKEHFERKYHLKAQGHTLKKPAQRVAPLYGISPEQIYSPGKYPRIVQARSLFCYWAVRELG